MKEKIKKIMKNEKIDKEHSFEEDELPRKNEKGGGENKDEFDLKKENLPQMITIKKRRFGSYIVAGLIWTFAQNFKKTALDELIILIIAIGTGFLYYPLKSKIKIKNEILRIILTFIIIEIVAGGLIGFLTALIYFQYPT
jgi:hypothetical protein